MTQDTLFDSTDADDPCTQGDDYAADRSACQYPHLKTVSAYTYGCRCIGCRKSRSAWSARIKLGPVTCAAPGCSNPKRRTQGAKYCDDHATSRNYNLGSGGLRPIICALCDQPASVFTAKVYPICSSCSVKCQGLAHRARIHGVPLEQFLRWARHPHCDLCDRQLYIGKGKGGSVGFNIDHDHAHCEGTTGCVVCVRGLLCQRCNSMIGGYEGLLRHSDVAKLNAYLRRS